MPEPPQFERDGESRLDITTGSDRDQQCAHRSLTGIYRRLILCQNRIAVDQERWRAWTSPQSIGRPEDEIIAAASEARAGFIILALRRGRGIFGPRQGATTYRILCTSSIPVLALPPP
jgi:hypothetical protein